MGRKGVEAYGLGRRVRRVVRPHASAMSGKALLHYAIRA